MHTDVKLGVVFSMVIVLVVGGYFIYPRSGSDAIPLAGDIKKPDSKKSPTKLVSGDKTPVRHNATAKKPPTRRNRTVQNVTPGRKSQQRRAQVPNRVANAGHTKRDLPSTGARLPAADKNGQTKSLTAEKNPASPRQNSELPKQPLVKKADNTLASGPASSKPVSPGSLKEKPGTPTPPGLLAATRTNETNKTNEPAVDLHRVQPGDTLVLLAQTYYGSTKYADFLAKSNPEVNPARLQVGMTLRIPALPSNLSNVSQKAPSSAKPASPPRGRTYTVKSGDSFYRIAERELGNASRWKELFELNRKLVGNDPSRLKIGQVLTLPAK